MHPNQGIQMIKTLNSKTNEENEYNEKLSRRESIHSALIKQIILHTYKIYEFVFSSHGSLRNTYIFINFAMAYYNRKTMNIIPVTGPDKFWLFTVLPWENYLAFLSFTLFIDKMN